MLRKLESDIDAIRFDPGDGALEIPVKLKVHDSVSCRSPSGRCSSPATTAASGVTT